MYDVIGDIHGHADALEQLLGVLGYREISGIYRHRERRAVFAGDFIDRGPEIGRVLQIVQRMTEAGTALAVMGNHELNALAFHTQNPCAPGEYLRCRTEKNVRQHQETVRQLSQSELHAALDWFRTLPLWLETEELRVVHACWDDQHIAQAAAALNEQGGVTESFLQSACDLSSPLGKSVEVLLKGKEADLPEGVTFTDKDGEVRRKFRTRWYLPPKNHTYRTYALQSDEINCDDPLPAKVHAEARPYPADARPVFVGHYWLLEESPSLLAHNVACLDYSVAKNGFLCGYRWMGERILNNHGFVWVRSEYKGQRGT